MLDNIETKNYKRDLDKLKGLPKNKRDAIKENLKVILTTLQGEKSLPASFKDHALHGFKKNRNTRECHVLSNVCLIYELKDNQLILLRIGNHSNLDLTENIVENS